MLPIGDKPTLQFIIEKAIESGIEEIPIITGRNKSFIENHFDKSVELEIELEKSGKDELLEEVRKISDMVNIHYIHKKGPRWLGHAIHCVKRFIGKEPFDVLLGDDIVYNPEKLCLKQMIEAYDKYKTYILGVQEVEREDICKYGIVDGWHIEGRIYNLKDLVERPSIKDAPSKVAILDRYIINPTIFEIFEHAKPGKGGEI